MALKKRLEEMARTIEAQEAEIERLTVQQQAHHSETTDRLSNIAKMLESQNRASAQEAMDVDRPNSPKRRTEEAVKTASTAKKSADKKNQGEEEKKKEAKVPPVILRNKDNWNEISRQLKNVGINYKKARLTGEGIQVFPATLEDYRALTRLLNERNREYHTYSLPENRLKRVVIRGLPDGTPMEEIKEDLEGQGFSPRSVQRMKSRRTKQNMSLVLVQVSEKDEGILDVTRCYGLVVRTEAQKQSKVVSQCHRC